MQTTAQYLRVTIVQVLPHLEAITEEQASIKPTSGKWSKKEVIGHLVDSVRSIC